jgi:hypothetical protein
MRDPALGAGFLVFSSNLRAKALTEKKDLSQRWKRCATQKLFLQQTTQLAYWF